MVIQRSGIQIPAQSKFSLPISEFPFFFSPSPSGLMISGFARAGQVLGEAAYTARAVRAAAFVKKYLYDEQTGRLLRSCYTGETGEVVQL